MAEGFYCFTVDFILDMAVRVAFAWLSCYNQVGVGVAESCSRVGAGVRLHRWL